MTQWDVYVEGNSDQQFLKCVTRHLGLGGIEYQIIGTGINGLHKMEPKLRQSLDAGKHIAAVVDANANPGNRKKELKDITKKLNVSITKSFFLPDDQGPGCLETLLEKIAVRPHDRIYRCFDTYRQCISNENPDYDIPDKKARIYAYCSALGVNTQPGERDYCSSQHWDLDAPALGPLKQFLCSLRS